MASRIPGQWQSIDPLHIYGQNTDIDMATTPEDIWDMGGVYPWPAAAAATTIESDDANDTAGGTGATEVTVIGLDENYLQVTQVIPMQGLTQILLNTDLLRSFQGMVTGTGSNEVNWGNITVKHGATSLLQIGAGIGETLMAIYTVPDDFVRAYLTKIHCMIMKNVSAVVELSFWIRPAGCGWRMKQPVTLKSAGQTHWEYEYPIALPIEAKTDMRWRVTSVSGNEVSGLGGVDLALVK